ncbi:RagB/SusD family nutrient uptake outer membrane protein [Halalkalibaculum sp. DA3122]|uniref:RagB/SusD family nutrient uptake outer membrane protein n=1 Tax=Halalkalibaculum sp. DA3122 TaxID=3373607 RepID=UPI00375521DD
MKNTKQLYKPVAPLIILLLVLVSCEGVLDLNEDPRDRVSAEQVFQDEAFAEALAADLYAGFPFNGFNSPGLRFDGTLGHHDLGTERGGNFEGCRTHGGMDAETDCVGLWDYEYIRDLNSFIENIRASELSEDFKSRLEGEARVLRAAVYFKMQSRYGGVPLVDVVLDPFEEVPEQYRVRSTEEALADFIDTELETAAGMLAGLGNPEEKGRVNEWTAYAYKARANLWSASIANFGTLADNGLTGIPSSRADEFYQKASDAAQQVINSGAYSLLQGGDPAQTYWNIFVEDSNPEIIFERIYNGVEINHPFAHQVQPTPFSEGQGSELNPTLGHVMSFENLDGTFTNPDLGPDNLYDNGAAPWANKDPRVHAQVLFQGDLYGGNVVQSYEGLDPTQGGTNPDNIISEVGVNFEGTPTVGDASRRQANQFFPSTGLLLYKYVPDEDILIPDDREDNNWKELRLAEMYLIAAESEFELGNLADAAEFLNYTRERVGLPELDAGTITRERVRRERTSELVYEAHRWDDLRRWRIAQDRLDGQRVQGVRTILHHETGQFYFIPMDAEATQREFRPEHYYNPITNSRIEENGDLVENPGY